MVKLAITLLVLSAAIYTANCLCNTCSAISGLACVADNKFKVCANGLPTPPAISCPSGTVCTPNAQVCVPIGSSPSSCARCNQCDDNGIFACTGYSTFALCDENSSSANSTEYTCPSGLVCNIDSPHICVNVVTTGFGATCPWIEPTTTTEIPEVPTTTTPNPETQSNAYCEAIKFPGRYKISSDTTCQKYISCILSGTAYIGNLYECPKNTYFNSNTQMCGVTKPTGCA